MAERACSKWYVFLIYLILAVSTFIAYEPVRHNAFLGYDDSVYVTNNPNVQSGLSWQNVKWAFTTGRASNWHPLTWLSHMLDCQLFGQRADAHHIINVLFHIANTLLLFIVFNRMTKHFWPSVFVAAVFALHPLHVDSVAWVAERKDVLSTLFWLLTMLAYARYVERPSTVRFLVTLLFFALGLLAKPMLVTLPFVLLLLDYWPLNRLSSKFSILNSLFEKLPFFVLSAASSVITFIVQQKGGAMSIIPIKARIANAMCSYLAYIGKMFWPARLAVFYPYPPPSFLFAARTVIYAIILILVTALLLYYGRQYKYLAVGWLWYLGTLVPVIGIVQVGAQAMANRYMYIPMLGLLIIVGWAVKDLVGNRLGLRVVTAVLAVAALSAAVIVTRTQVQHWRNGLTLYEYTLKVTENNELAEYNYASALFNEGRISEAELHLRNLVRINPLSSDRRFLGDVLKKQGKLNEAIACYNELIKQGQGSADVYYNLAVALGLQRKYDDAIKCLSSTLKLDPNYPEARKKMGVLLLQVTGKFNEAIPYFNEALRTDANMVKIYENLGSAYHQLGKYEEAILNWTKAVELKPNNVPVLNNLAWLLATVGDTSFQDAHKAVGFAQRACELTGHKDPECLDTLAAAYAAVGRFDDAVKTANRAMNIAKASGRQDLANEIESHIKLYHAGHPYRLK